MADTVKVGIISANWGVTAHLPAWRSVPGVEVVGICTAHQETAEKAAATHGIPRPFWDYGEMARSPDIDVVDVGTRPNLRHDMCLAAFAAGKHVYNGLPFAATEADSVSLHEAHRASGRVAMVDAYSEQFPPFRLARELIDEGRIGRVQLVSCRLELALFAHPFSAFPYNWFADASFGASAPRNLGSHALHLLVYLFGPVEQVAAQVERYVPEWHFGDGGVLPTEVADTGAMALRFAGGPIGVLTTSWSGAGSAGFVLDVTGSAGRLVLTCPQGMPSADATVQLFTSPGPMESTGEVLTVPDRLAETPGLVDPAPWDPGPVRAIALSFAALAQAVRDGGPRSPEPGFDRGYHVHSVIEAGYRSQATGAWERAAGG